MRGSWVQIPAEAYPNMWSLYQEDKKLAPLTFSNGKTQESVVNEVLRAINEGNKVVFIQGKCGTGKSVLALHLAKELGKTSIVVPGKSLQAQYKRDYESKKYILKKNNQKLKISVITGRNNHECLFLKKTEDLLPRRSFEINSKLNDIFAIEPTLKRSEEDKSADNNEIPCKIEIKEKNFRKIKEYLKKNNHVDSSNIYHIREVKRLPLATICPYWSPVLPDKYEPKNLDYKDKKSYMGLNGKKFTIYQRKPGCKFYEQFDSYVDADVIVFNALKYKLESAMNRKPATEAEIIDECDEFLDSFTNQRDINIDRLQNSLIQLSGTSEEMQEPLEEMQDILNQLKKNRVVNEAVYSRKVIPLKNTGIYDLFKLLNESDAIAHHLDEESYLFDVAETAHMFEDFLAETYVLFFKKDKGLFASVVTTNLAKKFKEMVAKNKRIILMSGTIHSEDVLKNIFGIEEFKIIEAETQQPGKIEIARTGLEFDCKHTNFSSGKYSRKDYLKALEQCVKAAKKPVLIHVGAFSDLPSEQEKEEYDLSGIISREKLKEMQKNDKEGKDIEKFKNGEIKVLFTTKCSRGVDFPGSQCESIIFTKYPNPNPEEPFWKILKETKPNQYWNFYRDKAKREILQKIYRGLRFKEDHVFLLSPDTRVLDEFKS